MTATKHNLKATRPFAADVSDATRSLEDAIDLALDVVQSDVLRATVGGVDYVIAPAVAVEAAA